MKTKEVQSQQSIRDVSPSRTCRKQVQGTSFSDALAGAVQRADRTEAPTQAGQVPAVFRVECVTAPGMSARMQGLAKGDELVSLLDQYGTALGDSGRTLRDVGQILDSVNEKVKEFGLAVQRLPGDDPLRGLLRQTEIIAAVETIKFNRGDYLEA